jgi:DNA polymerase-1
VTEQTLVLIDSSNHLFRCFHALPPLTTSTGIPTGALFGFAQVLSRFQRELKPTHIAAVLDGPGKKWRREIYPQYKSNRPPVAPEAIAQLRMVPRVVDAYAVSPLYATGFEADDVIGAVAVKAAAAGMKVIICSSDKDLLQVVSDRITVHDAMKNLDLGPAEVEAKWGVRPNQMVDLLALMGDDIDGIPGIKGVGKKTAAKLLQQFGSIANILANPELLKGKAVEQLRLPFIQEQVRLAQRLVQLRLDLTMPDGILEALRNREPDGQTLRKFLLELEFRALMPSEWPT